MDILHGSPLCLCRLSFPDDLKPLVRRMALQVSDTGFDDDCRRLVAAIEQALEKTLVEPRERDKRERLGVQEAERKQPARTLPLEHPRLRLLGRLSFVSFVLPGCVATGATREEVEKEMREAIEFHLEGLRLEGETIPAPRSEATYCEV